MTTGFDYFTHLHPSPICLPPGTRSVSQWLCIDFLSTAFQKHGELRIWISIRPSAIPSTFLFPTNNLDKVQPTTKVNVEIGLDWRG